jgi:chromate transporter
MKIGGFTIGGGLAMIGMMQNEIVERKRYATGYEMTDFLAAAQSLPGVVAINCATAVGNHVAGVWGAVFATAGMVTPSLVVIILVALIFPALAAAELAQKAFAGIRAAVCALLFVTAVRLYRSSVEDKWQLLLLLLSLAALSVFPSSPQLIILAAAFTGVAFHVVSILKSKKKGGRR